MPCTRPRSPPSSSSASRAIARRPWHRQHKACPKAASPRLALRQLLPPARRPLFLPQVHQSVHDAFVRLETRGGHVYNRREEDVKQEGREHAPLTKALFPSELSRAHPVVGPHECPHAIVELRNDWDHILWHTKTGEYCPEEGSVKGVVRFGKVDKAYLVHQRNLILSRQFL